MKALRLMLIAGEPSGDALAAEFTQAFRRLPAVLDFPWPPEFFGAGGPRMAEAGVSVEIDLTAHAVFGLSEALAQYRKFRGFFQRLLRLASERQPDAIILVDFGGFNLRFARAIRRRVRSRAGAFSNWNPKIVHYVSPQVWASRAGRAYELARNADLLLSIIPFEKDWYAARVPQLRVEFVGHPLIDRHSDATAGGCGTDEPTSLPPPGEDSATGASNEPLAHESPPRSCACEGAVQLRKEGSRAFTGAATGFLGSRRDESSANLMLLLLPGSRRHEVEAHLPPMIEACRRMQTDRTFRMRAVFPDREMAGFAASWTSQIPELEVRIGGLAQSLSEATLAIASSGTVTLECAFFGVPTIVVYRTSRITYEIARRIVTVQHIAMPNLLAGEVVFPELIQGQVTGEAIAEAALALLNSPSRLAVVQTKLSEIVNRLGGPGACNRAAEAVLGLLTGGTIPNRYRADHP